MVRINISIAIVSMVRDRHADVSAKESECFVALNESSFYDTNSSLLGETQEQPDVFPWDEYQQSLILGAFYWLHWVLTVPGGVFAHKIGTKIVFGFGNLIMCLLSMLIPAASHLDYRALIVIRVLQGIIGAVCWPSMHNMAASWIPPNERSKFVTAYLGSSIGAGLTFPLCGIIIDQFGWPAVFHATGLIGTAWFIAWWFLVFDTPAKHPRIDPVERQYIEDSLGRSVLEKKPPVPWKSILTSVPVWCTALSQFGGIWGLFTLLAQAPTYFKFIHGWDIRMTGILSGMPHFLRVLFAYAFSTVADGLLKRNAVNRDALRKFATVVSTIGQGLFILGLAFCGCNWMAAIVCVTMATMVNGAVSTGPLAILVDLSPNYASVLLGVSSMVCITPGFISPILVGVLTYQNQTVGQWQLVFLVSFVVLVVPGIIYVLFGSSVVQPWNNPEEVGQELETLQKNSKQVIVRGVDDMDMFKQVMIDGEENQEKLIFSNGKCQD